MKSPSRDEAERFWCDGWSSGSYAGLSDTSIGGFRNQTRGGEGGVATLRRAHTHSGETFYELYISVAHASRIDDVFDLQILIKVDELATFGMLENRPRVVYSLMAVDLLSGSRGQ